AEGGRRAGRKGKERAVEKAGNIFDSDSEETDIPFMGSSAAVGGKLGGKAAGLAPNMADFDNFPDFDDAPLERALDPVVRRFIMIYKTQGKPEEVDPAKATVAFTIALSSHAGTLGPALTELAEKTQTLKVTNPEVFTYDGTIGWLLQGHINNLYTSEETIIWNKNSDHIYATALLLSETAIIPGPTPLSPSSLALLEVHRQRRFASGQSMASVSS
ncbi:hypothetical protein FA15DRAFT_710330, partial [Coprinopsis marcescibilis]